MAGSTPRDLVRLVRRLAAPRAGGGDDAALLARFAAAGDEEAFAELVRRHGPMVRAVCRRVLRDDHLADDACQAAFLVLARKAGSVRRPGRLAGWLYGVGYRTALKARARRRRAVGPERPLRDVAMPPSQPDADWVDLRPVLDDEVSRLPDRYRDAFVLCMLEGRSLADAATVLRCPRGTVGRRLSWCRERLRLGLIRRGVTLSAAAVGTALVGAGEAAPLSAGFVAGLTRSAVLFLAKTGPAEGLPATAAALAEAVLSDAAAGRWRLVLGLTLLVSAAAVGAGATTRFPAGGRDRNIATSPEINAPPVEKPMGLVREFLGHDARVQDAAFTPDGRRLVTTGGDKTARVWDVDTGRELMALVGHASPVSIVATLPDNGRAVTAGSDGTIRLWDLTTGEELRQYAGHATNLEISGGRLDDLVNKMRSAMIADRGAGAAAREIDDSLADYRRYLLRPATPLALAVDPCGARLVTCSQDRTARIWDTATGKELLQLVGHTRAVWDARFLLDGQRVITAGADNTIRIWEANTGRQLGSLATPSVVNRLRLSADGRSVVCGCEDQLLWLEISDGERHGQDDPAARFVRALAGAVGVGKTTGDGATLTMRRQRKMAFPIDLVAFVPDGRVVVAEADATLRVWGLESAKVQYEFPRSRERTSALVVAPDGRHVVSTNEKAARLWRLPAE